MIQSVAEPGSPNINQSVCRSAGSGTCWEPNLCRPWPWNLRAAPAGAPARGRCLASALRFLPDVAAAQVPSGARCRGLCSAGLCNNSSELNPGVQWVWTELCSLVQTSAPKEVHQHRGCLHLTHLIKMNHEEGLIGRQCTSAYNSVSIRVTWSGLRPTRSSWLSMRPQLPELSYPHFPAVALCSWHAHSVFGRALDHSLGRILGQDQIRSPDA
jgi:hypothetical protein